MTTHYGYGFGLAKKKDFLNWKATVVRILM